LQGTLALGNSNALGSGTLTMLEGTTLSFAGGNLSLANAIQFGAGDPTFDTAGNDVTVSGVIAGAGALTKIGAGTLSLTTANTYTGATTVTAGTLDVEGSIASSSLTTVASGARLIGTGTVGTTQIDAGGVFAPGAIATPGTTTTVAGSLAFQSGAIYLVQINPLAASLASVTGTATLGGATLNAVFANGSYVAKKYTVLDAAGGVSGTFNSLVNTNLPSGFQSLLSYDANHAYLNLILTFGLPQDLNANQRQVGNALSHYLDSNGSIPVAFGALTKGALTQASGEVATATQQTTFDAMKLFMGVLTDPFVVGREDGSARAAPADLSFDHRWHVWAAGYGGTATIGGNAALGSNDATGRVAATAVGADYRLSPDTRLGVALAGGGTSFSVAGNGSGHSDLFQAGGFFHHTIGAIYVSGSGAYGWQDVTTDRSVAVASNQLQARFRTNAYSARLESGYRAVLPWAAVTPYAAEQVMAYDLPAYAERVLGVENLFALNYGARTVTTSRSELGVRADEQLTLKDTTLTLRGRAAWAHDYASDRIVAASFQALPGASFVVSGAAPAHDATLASTAAELKWRNGLSLSATFEGEFSTLAKSYAGRGVMRYEW
jgi:autotransporter-associated beta strand protein